MVHERLNLGRLSSEPALITTSLWYANYAIWPFEWRGKRKPIHFHVEEYEKDDWELLSDSPCPTVMLIKAFSDFLLCKSLLPR